MPLKKSKLFNKIGKKKNLPPGTLVYVGDENNKEVKITVFDYDNEKYSEKIIENIEECAVYKEKPSITWINVDGIHDIEIIEKIGKYFDLHPLLLEDVVNTEQRPKMEDFEDYIYIVLKMLYFNTNKTEIVTEQVSLVLGKNFLISFQEEKEGDTFDHIRERIRKNLGRVRKLGSDYLAYLLIDSVVDGYFYILEKKGEEIEKLDSKILEEQNKSDLEKLHELKKENLFIRKSVWHLRDAISGLQKSDSNIINENTMFYFRDIYDHMIQVIETVENFREILKGILDSYISLTNNKMSEVMKVLAIISTLFIPITFLAGLYGMNFEFMPEIKFKYSYPIVLSIMVVAIISMLLFFKKKKWI